jgi:hypothetical protein
MVCPLEGIMIFHVLESRSKSRNRLFYFVKYEIMAKVILI